MSIKKDTKRSSSMQSVMALVTYMINNGIELQEIADAASCDLAVFSDMDQRLAYTQIQQIWHLAIKRFIDYELGFKVASNITLNNLGVVGYIILSAPTLKDSLERLCHYHSIISEGVSLNIVQKDNMLGVECKLCDEKPIVLREVVDTFFSTIIQIFKHYAGEYIALLDMELQYCANSVQVYKNTFGVVPKFFKERNIMWFDASFLDQVNKCADKETFNILKFQADKLLDELTSESFSAEIKRNIYKQIFDCEKPSIKNTAENIGYSKRALQYKLSEQNTSFRILLEQSRQEIASKSLKEGVSSSDTAFLLGYSDLSAFNRAFKKWYGTTPSGFKNMT